MTRKEAKSEFFKQRQEARAKSMRDLIAAVWPDSEPGNADPYNTKDGEPA